MGIVITKVNNKGGLVNDQWTGAIATIKEYPFPRHSGVIYKLNRKDLVRPVIFFNTFENGKKVQGISKYVVIRDGTSIADMLDWKKSYWERFIKELLVHRYRSGRYIVRDMLGRKHILGLFDGWVE